MMCFEKKTYSGEKEATMAAEDFSMFKGWKTGIYQCGECGYWHIYTPK